ncbi:MAG: alpha/beta hydrolase-fold protein [Gemmatimonadaceae bacterium]
MTLPRLSFILQVIALPLLAQGADSTAWTRLTIDSKKLGEPRPVFVVTPGGYERTTERYPVLVLLDANDADQFALARANAHFLAGRGAIPRLIIVGIPNTRDRTHDLTPPAAGAFVKQFPTAGGADAFADFIVDEVVPLIRSRYRALPASILAGHSFGGLFALHVAATRPGTFSGIIAMSPALQWNDSALVVTYADAISRATTNQRIFATSGGLEPPIDVTTKHLAARLDSLEPKAAAFAYRFYPHDTHGLTPAPSLVDGLRFVFEPLSLAQSSIRRLSPTSDSASVVNAVLETEAQYARGARYFALPEILPEEVLNSFGYNVMQALKRPALAVWVFRRNAERYPESANVWDSLGDGLLAVGDSAGAKSQFAKAVDIATRTGHPVLAESRSKLESLRHAAQAGKAKP